MIDPLGVITRLWKPWPPSVIDALAQSLVVPLETCELEEKFMASCFDAIKGVKGLGLCF